MIRKNMKLIIGFVIGLMITSFGVYAANSLSASSISISKTNMSKVPQENLQSALDYLYSQSEKTNMITIESGVKHETQTYLGIAYLDPTNLENKCTSANSVSTTGTKTGCMKWYIYKDLGDSYKMILDHNTTARQAWNTDGEHGTNVEFKANNGNLVYNNLMELVSETGWVLTPDLISAEEIVEIVKKKDWENRAFKFDSDTTSISIETSNFAWLYDNLGLGNTLCTSYGCNYTNTIDSGAYWTKTTYGDAESGSMVWYVPRTGYLDCFYADSGSTGIRPVITVSKNIFD